MFINLHVCVCVCVGLCATCSHCYTLLLLHTLWHRAQSQNTTVQTYSSSSVLLRCSHAVHIKFMNSRKYTHNHSESINQNDQCAHTFSHLVSETTHKLLGGVWLLSVNISGRHHQHACLHQQLQRTNGRESGARGGR